MKFKRILTGLLTAVILLSGSAYANAATTYKIGDVNKNGYIGVDDVTQIQLYLCGIVRLSDTSLADFNGSGSVNVFDCTDIQMYCNETLKIYGSYLYTPDYSKNTAEIYAYQGKSSEITLPSYAYGWNYTFTSVKNSAFRGNKTITKLVVPSSYTSLGYYAFADCSNLQYVRIMNSRCHMDFSTFENCDNLAEWIVG